MIDPKISPEPLPEHDHLDDYEAHLQRGPLPVVTPPGERSGMLPGIAGIAVYVLVMSMVNAFMAARGGFAVGTAKYSVLAACTLLVVGAFGLLRLKRWGWALVIGGCVVTSAGFFYGFTRTRIGPYLIQALFFLVFFLYLSRTEVRERLR